MFAIFNLDFFVLPNTVCLLSQMKHGTKVLICTLLPIAVLFLLVLPSALAKVFSSAADEDKKRRIVAAFFFSMMGFLFLVYPFVSKVILNTFNCVDLGSSRWLKSDLRERCPEPSSFVYIWSWIFVFIVPIGVPAAFIVLLYYFKVPMLAQFKMKMHRLQAVLSKMGLLHSMAHQFDRWHGTTEPVNLLTKDQCKLLLEFDFGEEPGAVAFELEGANDALQNHLSGMNATTGEGRVEVADNTPLHEIREKTSERVEKLCKNKIVAVTPVSWRSSVGNIEREAIEKCGFLFITYKADCWWFEVFDMLRKVTLSGIISFVDDPDIRLGIAFVISFFSLMVVVSTHPFLSPSVDFFMIVALITQTLTLACLCPRSRPFLSLSLILLG